MGSGGERDLLGETEAGIPGEFGSFSTFGSFRNLGLPYFGVLMIRILLFRVFYSGPPFSETPILLPCFSSGCQTPRGRSLCFA